MVQQTIDDLIKDGSTTKLDPKEYGKYMERILKECLSVEKFEEEDRREVIDFFKCEDGVLRCAYCGDSERKLGWDHIVPAIQSGDVKIGNMVIACRTCNASKGKKSYQAWLCADTPKSLKGRDIGHGKNEDHINRTRERLEAYIENYHYSTEASLAHEAYCEDQERKRGDRKSGNKQNDQSTLLVKYKLDKLKSVPEEGVEIRDQFEELRCDIRRLVKDLIDLSCRYDKVMSRKPDTR